MPDFGNWTDPEFTIAGVHFVVRKLPPEQRFNLMEDIRFELRHSAGLAAEEVATGTLLTSILSLEPGFVRRVRDTLFRNVTFQGSGAGTPQPLMGANASAVDMAFADLEPSDIYVVLTRALAVNFLSSLRGLGSALTGLSLNGVPQNLVEQPASPDTFGPSSPRELT